MIAGQLLACAGAPVEDSGAAEGEQGAAQPPVQGAGTAAGDPSGSSVPPADGGAGGTVDAPTPPSLANAEFFRADSLRIVEPGIVIRPLGLQTDVSAGAQTAVDLSLTQDNETITDRGLEGGQDGIVDLSLLFRFDLGADPGSESGIMAMGGGRCPAPLGSAPCEEELRAPLEPLDFVNLDRCPVAMTGYETPGRCFNVNADGIVLEIIGIGNIPLERATIVGQYQGDPVEALGDGVIHGFLSEETANTTTLPEALPTLATVIGITGEKPVREFLSDDDLSTNEEGVAGWWFTVEYSAAPVEFSGQP